MRIVESIIALNGLQVMRKGHLPIKESIHGRCYGYLGGNDQVVTYM
jgi:hypothetical protein